MLCLILGIGVDLCKISRMQRMVENEYFISRIFHPAEVAYASSKAYPEQHYASSFASREAFAKASGLPFLKIVLQGVWVDRTVNGPVLQISERLVGSLPANKGLKTHLTISHEGEYVIAFVILEVD